jgi:hypothetical protein
MPISLITFAPKGGGVELECWMGSCANRFIVLGGAFSKKDEFCTFKGYDVDALMRNILF